MALGAFTPEPIFQNLKEVIMSTQFAAQKSKVVAGMVPTVMTAETILGGAIDRSPAGSMADFMRSLARFQAFEFTPFRVIVCILPFFYRHFVSRTLTLLFEKF